MQHTDYPEKNSHRNVWVVGCCNGIICVTVDDRDIFLWNPSMRTSKKLPPVAVEMKEGYKYNVLGFGYNECDDDYKVVRIFCVLSSGVHESVVKIYSLKADSWKRIEDFKGGVPFDTSGKYASGKLHFAASPGIVIDYYRRNFVSLDLKSEVYGMVEQPDYGVGSHALMLGVLGGCICAFNNYRKIRGDVWILKEYNVKESWTRVISIPYINYPGNFIYTNPLLVLPSGEVLLAFEMHFVVYNPKDNSFRCPEITNADSIEADIYVESLVSL